MRECGPDSPGTNQGQLAGCCGHGNDQPGYIKF
jgi:hypothetical protein